MLQGVNMLLYQYRERYEQSFRLSDRLVASASDAFAHCDSGIISAVRAAKIFVFGIVSMPVSMAENARKKKRLRRILSCSKSEIAFDVNELGAGGGTIACYGDDFVYNAAIAKNWLKNIRVIFGDAHLEALDEMNCLSSLGSVWGSVYVSRCTDLNGLNLAIIKGDFHGEKLEAARGLEHLVFVGGKIFYQEKEFLSLEDFRRFVQL